MADKELKPKSFRIDDDTAERIKGIAGEIGGNQQEALAKMIEAYEFQKGKAVLTERKEDIDRFEKYLGILARMYMGSLEDNQNASDTIRMEFASQLDAKDMIIKDLQEKCGSLSKEYEAAILRADKLKEANVTTTGQLEQSASMLADKESLNKALADTVEELKKKNNKMTQEVLSARETSNRLLESERRNTAAAQEVASLKKLLEETTTEIQRSVSQAVQSKELEFERKMIEIDKEHQAAMHKVENEKRAEIDSYQTKYLLLLEKINERGS